MQDLIDINDPDWASFQSGDPEWFLGVAGDAVRRYCGWHIYPNLQLTQANLEIGSKGLIELPATYVTAVESLTVQSQNPDLDDLLVDPQQYTWYENGMIEPIGWHFWSSFGGYYYGPDNWSFLPMYQYGLATAVFNAGYDDCPREVKAVAFELAGSTIETPYGNVKDIQAPPGFRLQLAQAYGATLNADQKCRLANFRIGGYK
jgi:hypothetical protein